eukprot:9486175-Pyramimonas_sp.AAC.1
MDNERPRSGATSLSTTHRCPQPTFTLPRRASRTSALRPPSAGHDGMGLRLVPLQAEFHDGPRCRAATPQI